MNAKAKLLAAILANPKNVRFSDACKAATLLGFERKGGAGSHCTFVRKNEPTMLNFQNRNGNLQPYQARQLVVMIERYGDQV